MADDTFGAGLTMGQDASPWSGATSYGADTATAADAPQASPTAGAGAEPPAPASASFGSGLSFGPPRYSTDPQASALDRADSLLQQRAARASQIVSNPLLQVFAPEQVQRAREFIPQAAEQQLKIQQQKAAIAAGRQEADTLGLQPGEVPDAATREQRVDFAKNKALAGDLRAFKGLQAVDPKAAESIQDQVHETAAKHLDKAQYAFDSLSMVQNQGQYAAKVDELRQKGVITDLEALGLKVPPTFDAFGAVKAKEGQALREARIGIDTIRQKLEERNTYQPMEKKEAETYNGRMTTAYGDQITNGTWARNAAAGTRGLVVNGASDPRELGKTFTFATPEQRKAIKEEFDGAVPKEDLEKYRAFNRTYQMAVTDAKGNPLPEGRINTNPNVQQGVAEGLASVLRGGQGGANVGLLKIETNKRGFIQNLLDTIAANKGAAIDTITGKDVSQQLTKLTQGQIRDVLDYLRAYNEGNIGDRATAIAQRAGALGLDTAALGLGKGEVGGVADAVEQGRQAQIARMMPQHQAIGGGDGVFQLGAQRPGSGATNAPPGTQPTTQVPGAPALQTPVQQATNPPAPSPGAPGPNQPTTPRQSGPTGSGPGGGGPAQPVTIAGQQVSAPMPPGASPNYLPNMQRIESGNERDPWRAGASGSSASGAFQFIKSTWDANKPVGAPDRAADATPQQQAQALATLTAKNAEALKNRGLPVNDTTLYIAHNLGEGGASKLLTAAPNADARSIVGEAAAKNNPLFFRGKPTVATALARYQANMNGSLAPVGPDDGGPIKPKPFSPSALAAAGAQQDPKTGLLVPSLKSWLKSGDASMVNDAETFSPEGQQAMTENAAAVAPAALSTLGAIGGGMAGGPLGAAAGGAAGGGAGQAVRSYLRGEKQDPTAIAKETALGGVLGIAPAGRPIVGAVARAAGAGAVEAGAEAVKGGSAEDVADAGLKGSALAAGGEAFGRALGMVAHKIWSRFAPDAKVAVREAAAKYAAAEETLASEAPKLPSVGGTAGGPNPKYEAAVKAKEQAEMALKDAGINPEEAAYAHKVSSEGVPKQEAEAAKPGELEKKDIGKGYQQLEEEVGQKGVGAPKANVTQSNFPINETPREKIMRTGYNEVVRVDAAKLQNAANSAMSRGLAINPDKLEAVRKAGAGDGYPRVDVSNGRVTIEDGVHRTTVAAERGQTIDVVAKTPKEAAALRKLAGPDAHLPDGPRAAVAAGKVSKDHAEIAQRTEALITAPAKDWREKWVQLKDARSALLDLERDALTSTTAGRTQIAKDMRALADTVRAQQEKAAKYVFGEEGGKAVMQRLKVLDTRYRNLMEATNGGKLEEAAKLKGEAGREADRKFRAFAHDDPAALAAWSAMRQTGSNVEKDVRTLVGAEKIPYLGKLVSAVKMASTFREWVAERAAGSPAKFEDIIKMYDDSGRRVRDVTGTAAARAATM